MKRHFDRAPEIFPPSDGYAVFCDSAGHPDDINLLKCIVSDQGKRHLPRKADQRNAVIVGVRKSRQRVRRARTARHQAYPDFSGGFCIALRLMYQTLFMSRQDDVNHILLI